MSGPILFSRGPVGIIEWTSQYTDSGVMGEAEKATAEKGKIVFEEASKNLAQFVEEYYHQKIETPTQKQAQEPTFPLSFTSH